jgi:Sec34-like family
VVAILDSFEYNSCEQLVAEKDHLVEFAEALRSKLKHFEEFESILTQVVTPGVRVHTH